MPTRLKPVLYFGDLILLKAFLLIGSAIAVGLAFSAWLDLATTFSLRTSNFFEAVAYSIVLTTGISLIVAMVLSTYLVAVSLPSHDYWRNSNADPCYSFGTGVAKTRQISFRLTCQRVSWMYPLQIVACSVFVCLVGALFNVLKDSPLAWIIVSPVALSVILISAGLSIATGVLLAADLLTVIQRRAVKYHVHASQRAKSDCG